MIVLRVISVCGGAVIKHFDTPRLADAEIKSLQEGANTIAIEVFKRERLITRSTTWDTREEPKQ